jgi:hypothetical protein
VREIHEVDACSDRAYDLGAYGETAALTGRNLSAARQQRRALEPSGDLGNEQRPLPSATSGTSGVSLYCARFGRRVFAPRRRGGARRVGAVLLNPGEHSNAARAASSALGVRIGGQPSAIAAHVAVRANRPPRRRRTQASGRQRAGDEGAQRRGSSSGERRVWRSAM